MRGEGGAREDECVEGGGGGGRRLGNARLGVYRSAGVMDGEEGAEAKVAEASKRSSEARARRGGVGDDRAAAASSSAGAARAPGATIARPAGAFSTVSGLVVLLDRFVGVGVGVRVVEVAGGDVREASSAALATGDLEAGVGVAHLALRVAAGAEPDERASGVDEGERSSALTVQLESLRGGPHVVAYPTQGRVRVRVRAEGVVDGGVHDGIGEGNLGGGRGTRPSLRGRGDDFGRRKRGGGWVTRHEGRGCAVTRVVHRLVGSGPSAGGAGAPARIERGRRALATSTVREKDSRGGGGRSSLEKWNESLRKKRDTQLFSHLSSDFGLLGVPVRGSVKKTVLCNVVTGWPYVGLSAPNTITASEGPRTRPGSFGTRTRDSARATPNERRGRTTSRAVARPFSSILHPRTHHGEHLRHG